MGWPLLALAVLVFSACGSDSAKTAATRASTAAPAPASNSSPTTEPLTQAPASTVLTTSVADTESSAVVTSAPATVAPPTSTASSAATAAPVSTARADGGDPCRLLTAGEAEALLGAPVGPPTPLSIDAGATGVVIDCSYSTLDQSSGPTTVHVGILASEIPRDAWEQAERADGGVEVSGVGELAFFDSYNEEMNAFDHGRWIQAQMINTDESTLETDLSQVVNTAIGRI